jgi:hypothetical protein
VHLLRTVRSHYAPLQFLIGGAETATRLHGGMTLGALTTAA